MKKLILAEAQKNGIPLNSASIPMQINVADGGEDGRIEWHEGCDKTDYFPSRFNIFQSKAKNKLTVEDVKAEVIKKANCVNTRNELSFAIETVIANKGSYIIFTSAPLVNKKIDELKKAMLDAIKEFYPNFFNIQIYDANKISNWVNTHRSVKLWVHEILSSATYGGFISYESWGKESNYSYKWVDEEDSRFIFKTQDKAKNQDQNKDYQYELVKTNFLDHIKQEQKIVRIFGASGLGKSRLVFEFFNNNNNNSCINNLTPLIVYCNAYTVKENALVLANNVYESKQRIILVVDDCDDSLHYGLMQIFLKEGSKSSLVTINIESKVKPSSNTITIELKKASDKVIKGIIEQAIDENSSLSITKLAEGFPGMAVIAANSLKENSDPITKIEEIIDRILWDRKAPDRTALSSLQALCLFGVLGYENDVYSELESVATDIVGIKYEEMHKNLLSFIPRGIIEKVGDHLKVQPFCLMINLAEKYLEELTLPKRNYLLDKISGSISGNISNNIYLRVLPQIKWLKSNDKVKEMAKTLLSENYFRTFENIANNSGSKLILCLANILPELTMKTLVNCFENANDKDIDDFKDGLKNIIYALEILIFSEETFLDAAKILLKLAGSQHRAGLNDTAAKMFIQLYYIALSGTEVSPKLRLEVLDECYKSNNEFILSIYFNALEAMLKIDYFSSDSLRDFLCDNPELKDWEPATEDDVYEYHRQGILRLCKCIEHDNPNAKTAANIITRNIQSLLTYEALFDDVKQCAKLLQYDLNKVHEILICLNSWICNGNNNASDNYKSKVIELAKSLMPTSVIEHLIFLTKGHPSDLSSLNLTFKKDSTVYSYNESTDESIKLAKEIAKDQDLALKAAIALSSDDSLKNTNFAMNELALNSSHSEDILYGTLDYLKKNKVTPNSLSLLGFLNGIISKKPDAGKRILEYISKSEDFKVFTFNLIERIDIDKKVIEILTSLIRDNIIDESSCVLLPYKLNMSPVMFEDIEDLLSAFELHNNGRNNSITFLYKLIFRKKIQISNALINYIKEILLDLKIYKPPCIHDMYFTLFYQTLLDAGALDSCFVSLLTKQLFMYNELDLNNYEGNHCKIIRHCIRHYPQEVWLELAKAFENRTIACKFCCKEVCSNYTGKHTDKTEALGELPENLYIPWVNEDIEKRLPFILQWIPLIDKNDDKLVWHSKFKNLLDNVEPTDNAFATILYRIHPNPWFYSLSAFLDKFVPLLEDLATNHSNIKVKKEASKALEKLKTKIAKEQKLEEKKEQEEKQKLLL